MRLGILLLPALFLALASGAGGAGLPGGSAAPLPASLELAGPLDFCGEKVPQELPDVRERLEKELLLISWNRPQVILWLKRATRYMPTIDAELREAGVPADFRFLAVVESALQPHVGSSKGAVGFWQFLAATGRRYGLRIDARIDQRRNLVASTRAAARYLRELHGLFGTWTLAAAAYNMGEERLQAEILEQGVEDYHRLYLPLETQRFVFRILAVKLVMSDPARFGYHLAPEDHYPPWNAKPVQLDCPDEVPIRILAHAAGTHFKAIKDLNPEIRGHYLPAGRHELLVPAESAAGFPDRYAAALQRYLTARKEQVYVVKPGDTLSAIAVRFEVPLPALLIWNRLDPRKPIHPGNRLVVYRQDARQVLEETEESAEK